MLRDMPFRFAATRKEGPITWAEPSFHAVIAFDVRLARHNDERFVLVVMPGEPARCAIPDHDVLRKVAAVCNALAACRRVAADHPARRHRLGVEIRLSCGGEN